jgi:hypothetical protein
MDKKTLLLFWAISFASGNPDSNWFSEESQSRGLHFRHFHGGTGEYFLPESLGSGVALIDYDNDGDLDVYLLQGASLNSRYRPAAAAPSNRLFRNMRSEEGRLRFVDVTAQARLAGTSGYSLGAAVGDYDLDGWLDLYVTGVGRTILYRNNGNGTFTDTTAAAGVADNRVTTAAAFFDADRDGDLDLLVLSYVDFTVASNRKCPGPGNRLDYCQPAVYHPLPARYFRNDGAGRFTDQSDASGFGSAAGAGLGIAVADFDQNGWLDVYVANDGTPNHLWMNRKQGRFEETALPAGAAYDDQGRAQAGMGVSAGDFDGDGDEDLIVANLMGETLALYENDGQAEFLHATVRRRLAPPSLPFTGFGAVWADFDHDGALDLFIANGSVKALDGMGDHPYPYGQRNQLFRNDKNGFVDVRMPVLDAVEASRGVAAGDLDNDGDIDLVVSNSNGPARLLLNRKAPAGQSLTVRLMSDKPIEGTRIGLTRKDGSRLWRRSSRSGSYLSSNSPDVHFGVAPADVERIVVEWPDGGSQTHLPNASRITIRRAAP